ncbi:hypothetical protein PDESU_00196 [Pontiella desulfatans]|uniref:Runt domain-containing protein n=1 Tax=Pontiella desulfatans TaxID=2750659 RepID=A0A6C2TWE7_PONDE|nr:hypothetical protein [Pontiella desulfatans]VGO11651.1 hypothetical protein PDESU_00196 [Pontiella desulfatans]
MSDQKQKKRYFAKHAKSSAALISLGIHAVLILVAVSFVAVTVIQKEDQKFEYKKVSRPKQKLKKLQVPVKVKKNKPKPKLRKRVVVKDVKRNTPEFKMPEITGVKGGVAGMGDGGGVESIGFSMPEMDFFGAKAKGEKVCFVVHFGPATIGPTPFDRMTGLTIRNRLVDLVEGLPEYTLFNVTSYWASDCWAMEPNMQLATPANKQKVKEWMAPVNPLEGNYQHCFAGKPKSVDNARGKYPTKVTGLPSYAPKWVYPYAVPGNLVQKYAATAKGGIMHWGRGVAWAILEQKPDTIFVLTTNYIDGWGSGSKGQPSKMAASLKQMCTDSYGPDRKKWPTINIVVLTKAGKDSQGAGNVLNAQFGPIWKGFNADGSVIDDIKKFMNEEERDLYRKYQSQYGSK